MNARRKLWLAEMGYRLWRLRPAAGTPLLTSTAAGTLHPASPATVPDLCESGASQPALADAEERSAHPEVAAGAVSRTAADEKLGDGEARAAWIAGLDWDALGAAVQDCRACELCRQRRQAVLGVGDRQADWLFVGEGPGAEEDARGEPFVGQAGRLLDAMLAAIGLRRGENVYIANAVKCRPEGNRTPTAAEIATCRPFLQRQIALIQPRLIVLLGKSAVHGVLGEDKPLASLRQKIHVRDGIPVLVTYHPAYLLRNLPDKAKAWEDLCLARRQMAACRAGARA
jgi:DNA polymerase